MGWHEYLIEDDESIRHILRSIQRIAVIGIKDETKRDEAAHSVPAYLRSKGYEIVAVNPHYDRVFGEECYDTIADVPEPVDAVLVFRAPRNIPPHVEEVLQLDESPRVFWMQSGIAHMDAAHRLAKAGIKVVQDHCIYREHLRLFREDAMFASV